MSWEEFERRWRLLPPLEATKAPWNLAKSKVSVNLPDGGKVRQEVGAERRRMRANARLIAAAPTTYNLTYECLYTLAQLFPSSEGRSEVVTEQMGLMVDVIAWIHNDPMKGHGLRYALDLPIESPREDQRPVWGDEKPARKKAARK